MSVYLRSPQALQDNLKTKWLMSNCDTSWPQVNIKYMYMKYTKFKTNVAFTRN